MDSLGGSAVGSTDSARAIIHQAAAHFRDSQPRPILPAGMPMNPSLRLVLIFNNHQPVGNFDGVFEQAYQDSYLPFLEVFEQYPDLPIGLHTSGSLMEWLVARHPEYLE